MRPRFAPLAILACALLAVNAVLARLDAAATARLVIPCAALVILLVAFDQWRRS